MKTKVIILAASLVLLVTTACGGNQAGTSPGTNDCTSDSDCERGRCEGGQCSGWDLGEGCANDGQCSSGICVDLGDGSECLATCTSDAECQGELRCLPVEERPERSSCQAESDDPTEPGGPEALSGGFGFCAAGGLAEGAGIQLTHCFAPYELSTATLQGGGVRLEGGAFRQISNR